MTGNSVSLPWAAQQESRLRERRGHARLRAEGAGPAHELPFADRVIATLVVLRFQLPHAALALFYGMDRSTITRAVHEIRPAAGGPWPRRAWPARAAAAHPGRRIRLRRVPGRPPAHRRHRGAGPPAPGQPARTP